MFYTCYWNTFQYKYIQITFHVVKQYHARVTSKYFFYSLLLLFVYLFLSLSICLITLRGWTFPWAFWGKLITLAKCVTLTILAKTLRKIDKYFSFAKSNLHENSFRHLRHFVIFLCCLFSLKDNLTSRQNKQES